MDHVPPPLDRAAPFAGDEDREVVVVVAVAVADPAPVDDHRVVEDGAVPLADRAELVQEVGELLDVVEVDLLDLRLLVAVLAVVREVVVPLRARR